MLQHWRANVDLQMIVDVNACARYLTKYISKSEPRSKTSSEIFANCLSQSNASTSPITVFKRCMIKSVGERDFGAQETAHLLLSLPLYRCTYNFITLSLDGGQLVSTDGDTSDPAIQPSLINVYSQRIKHSGSIPNIMSLNLLQFTSTYSVTKEGEPNKRSYPVIVKSFPNYSSDPRGPKYSLYCKYQLIKLKPWKDSSDNAWDNQAPSAETYISKYHNFLQTDYAHTNNYSSDLERAEQYARTQGTEDDYEYQSPTHQDEWMLLCQLQPTFQHEIEQTSNVDWASSAHELPQPLLRSSPNWISATKAQLEGLLAPRDFPQVDITTLNHEQYKAYSIVSAHCAQNTNIPHQPPLLMLILGTAGTGKSYLIRTLAQLLGEKCLLTGTTGLASFFLIGGSTIHSNLALPVRTNNKTDLTGNSLARLQYIIVDEMSMLGQRTMEWVDRRLRQASGYKDTPFGGHSVILIGDFAQLPPVGD